MIIISRSIIKSYKEERELIPFDYFQLGIINCADISRTHYTLRLNYVVIIVIIRN